MYTIRPTRTGVGVELTSSIDEMHQLYDWVYDILNIDYDIQDGPDNTRDMMIQSFACEIRRSFTYAEIEAEQKHIVPCSIQMIWPDAIVYLMCLRQKAAYVSLKTWHLEVLNQLEGEMKRAMHEYDEKSAAVNENLIQPIFDLNTDYLFLLQHHLHNEYINTKPRKTAFKKLASLMHNFLNNLGAARLWIELDAQTTAKKNHCSIRDVRASSEYLEVKKW